MFPRSNQKSLKDKFYLISNINSKNLKQNLRSTKQIPAAKKIKTNKKRKKYRRLKKII